MAGDYRKQTIVSIGGFDPSGCAGVIVDFAVTRSLGFHPCGVITTLTFQNTCKGHGVVSTSLHDVERQLNSIFEDFQVVGVKIGLINSSEIAGFVSDYLKELDLVVVWDPVMRSTTGLNFQNDSFIEIARKIGEATDVITPNVDEAEFLSGMKIENIDSAKECARMLSKELNSSVVITGGRIGGIDVAFDGSNEYIVSANFSKLEIRGTGCVYSSALTCFLSRGEEFESALRLARLYLLESIKKSRLAGRCLPCISPTEFEL
jgi:hydroxymethylpyrimidine/phosphomethylpyrimidine kinase